MADINILDEEIGIELIAEQAVLRNLVPVFGAGFTVGSLASNGSVPDCNGAKEHMIKEIKRVNPELTDEIIKEVALSSPNEFCGIAELYFENVPEDDRSAYFYNNFTNVVLPQELIDFLDEVNWPYAYTINFDDAIENNSSFTQILPYRKFKQPNTSVRLLYKLHGDAKWESNYDSDNQQNIVFSSKQYLQAINSEENFSMRNCLRADLMARYVVYIGCSLAYEPDLEYIYESIKKEIEPNSKRIIIRNQKPSFQERRTLKRYGITDVIIVAKYADFYGKFLEKYREIHNKKGNNLYSFYNPRVKNVDDKERSLELLANGDIFSENEKIFERGRFQVVRNACIDINARISETCCIILKGRRFSGKTAIMCDICRSNTNRDCYYFPSSTVPDEDIVRQLFKETRNSIFLFDSNSMSSGVYFFIIDNEDILIGNNHSVVIAVNSSDNYLATKFKRIKPYVVEIPLYFCGAEITQNNTQADMCGISKRNKSLTNADYLYRLKRNKMITLPDSSINVNDFNNHEIVVLLLLAVLEKVYCSDLIALGIPNWETEYFIKKVNQGYPIVESVKCTPEEATKHSTIKIVHNSKIAILELLDYLHNKEIIECIQYIVSRCKNDYNRKRMYIDVILYDTLNQLFESRLESGQLINQIYQNLENTLFDDLHFWLQRSKFLYRTYADLDHLNIAYQYAKKVHDDGWREIKPKSALNISLISCAMAEIEPDYDEKRALYLEGVENAYEAVTSDYYSYNSRYLYDALAIGSKKQSHSVRRIKKGCNYLLEKLNDSDTFRIKCMEILNRFRELEAEYTTGREN